MKKALCIFLCLGLCFASSGGLAINQPQAPLKDTGKSYTAHISGMTALQGEPAATDRQIAFDATALADNPLIPGQSPTTGRRLEASGLYMPLLVQISNAVGEEKDANGRQIKAAGLGKRAPWGGQYADIVYESLLNRDGQTRMAFLFSDSFADGLPLSAGPVRSARVSGMMLSKVWGGGFVCAGMAQYERAYIAELGDNHTAYTFNLLHNRYHEVKNRVKGVKAPDNYNINPMGIRSMIPGDILPIPHPFLFEKVSPYGDGYAPAFRLTLDWGRAQYISGFIYDPSTGLYQRYCGDLGGAPYKTLATVSDRSPAHAETMTFSNVIIQRITYAYPQNTPLLPVLNAAGQGNADIFIGGRYIPGYWVCQGYQQPTVFFDDQGRELRLTVGRTYIAQFSPQRLLAYQGEP